MQLTGEIDPALPLFVVAVEEEAEHLRALGLPLLVTGAFNLPVVLVKHVSD